MSLVIGMRIADAVVFACDGFALLENKKDGSTKKLETRTKLTVLHDWNLVLGYVGETEALIDIVSPIFPVCSLKTMENGFLDAKSQCLTEQEFLSHLGSEISNLHLQRRKIQIVLVCGYYDQNGQQFLCCFDRESSPRQIAEFVCIGSGSGIASTALSKSYNADITIGEAVRILIDAVFKASVVPTVNALPMIVVLKETGVHDFTATTLEKHKNFHSDLRSSLISQAANIGK
jgi:20S proteasome alpha/beta subunit